MSFDFPAIYRSNREGFTTLVLGLDDDALAATVPATPLWTVKDAFAHVTGVASDYTTGRLDSQSAGLVQLEAWQDVTGFPSHLIGEEICLLSSGHDRKFSHGCLNASRFMEELTRPASTHPDHLSPGSRVHGLNYDRSAAMALWSDLFDGHIESFDRDPDLPP